MTNSLEGIRVIDFSESLAGPFCTQILADLGADVIKVERPGGDAARHWGPPFINGESAIFLSANRGKRSITLDLSLESAHEVVRRLVESADVVVQSFRPGAAEALGFGAQRLRGQNPRLIYCSISAFGEEGPLRDKRGYDPLAQAYGALMSVTGHPDQPPVRLGISAVDMGTGMWAALGILATLRTRELTGAGDEISISLLDTATVWMSYHLIGFLGTGSVPKAQGSALGIIAPYEAFRTSDGWVMIAAATDRLFERLCSALSLQTLLEDSAFETNASRVRSRARLRAVIDPVTNTSTTAELLELLSAHGVPCAPILDVADLARLEQLEVNQTFVDSASDAFPDLKTVALPLHWSARRAADSPPPAAGQDGETILGELGFPQAEIDSILQSPSK